MRVLLIDKNLVDPANHRKWTLLAQKPGVFLSAVTPDPWIENEMTLRLPRGAEPGFRIRTMKVAWPRYYNRGFYLNFPRLASLMASEHPDVVLVFEEPFAPFAFECTLAARIAAPLAKLAYYTWDNLSYGVNYPGRWPAIYRAIARFVFSRADLVIAATQEGAGFLPRLTRAEVKKIYFGVDLGAPVSASPGEPLWPGRFVVGYIGRLLSMKGLDTLLDALHLTDDRVCAVLVGNGAHLEHLRERVIREGLSGRVRLQGGVPSSEVGKIMQRFDVLVLPSITTPDWKEQYGRVLVEAMSRGVALIGSSSGAIPDVVGDAGLIFPEGNAQELARCIGILANDRVLRTRYGANGLRRSERFSASRFADDLYASLTSLLAGRPASSPPENAGHD